MNSGQCAKDRVCQICGCSCAFECGNGEKCPYDSEDDADSDKICGNVDSCPYDNLNDADSDKVCGNVIRVDMMPSTILIVIRFVAILILAATTSKMMRIVIRSVVTWMHVNMMLKMILTRMVDAVM